MNFFEQLRDKDPLVNQYEQNKLLGYNKYYDIDEFCQIIDYYYFSQEFKKAMQAVNDATGMHPLSFDLLLRKARVLIELKKYIPAIKILNFLIKESPQEQELFLLLGFSLATLGHTKLSEINFLRLIKLAGDEQEKISILNDIAYIYLSLKKYDKAYKYYKQAYDLDTSDFHLLYEMAYCLEKLNINEKSKELYIKYLENNPYSKLAWYNLGVVYIKLNEKNKALEAIDFALAIDPEFSSAIYNKAHLLFETQKYEESIYYYKKILKLENNNPSAFFFIAKNLIELKKYHSALIYLQKALGKVPFFPQAWHEIAKILYLNDKYRESKHFIFKAIKQGELSPNTLKLLGNIYMKENNFSKAEIAFKWAALSNPFDAEIWLKYSEVFEKTGNYKKALEILHNSQEFIKENPNIKIKISYLSNITKHSLSQSQKEKTKN